MSIESVRKRLAGATPGPWRIDEFDDRLMDLDIVGPTSGGSRWPPDIVSSGVEGDGGVCNRADAELIVHAPTDLELLCAVAEAAARLTCSVDASAQDEVEVDVEGHAALSAALSALEEVT